MKLYKLTLYYLKIMNLKSCLEQLNDLLWKKKLEIFLVKNYKNINNIV